MNRNLFKSFAVAALSILAVGCAKEQVTGEGGMVEASFSVDVPGNIATKATGDGMTATKLYYQVFDSQSEPIEGLGVQTTTLDAGKATVSFQLIKDQTYNFVFWAQTPKEGYYTVSDTDGLKTITADYTTHKEANDENRDAFFAVENLTISGPVSKTIELKRPFAQLNIATKGEIKAGEAHRAVDFTSAKSKVTIGTVPTVFSPLAESQLSSYATVSFESADVPDGDITVGDDNYKYLSVSYVFAPETERNLSDVTAVLTIEGKEVNLKVPNAPTQRNYRTNIVGDLLTNSADFNVVVDPGFEGDKEFDLENVTSAAELNAALSLGGKITVTGDITSTAPFRVKKENTTINISENVTVTGDLTGYNSKTLSYFDKVDSQILSGEGTIIGPNVTNLPSSTAAIELEDNANDLVINGNLTVKGRKGTKSGRVDACMIIRAGKVTINGGHFIADADVDGKENPAVLLYSPNGYRSELVINDGTFESLIEGNSQYLINMQDEYREHCKVSIYGGKFKNFDPANVNEGTITSFLAPGYKSTKVGDYYIVTKEDVTPVADQETLNLSVKEENTTIKLTDGEYTIPSSVADGITIEGGENTIINIPSAVAWHNMNVTFKGITLKSPNKDYVGIQHASSIRYENCIIEGQPFSYAGITVFENCTFNQTSSSSYNIWTYGSKDITFNKCKFNCAGKAALVYKETGTEVYKATFNECTFIATSSVEGKAAIEIDSSLNPYEVYINKCSSVGFANGTKSGNSLWNNKKGDSTNLKVVVDGVEQELK